MLNKISQLVLLLTVAVAGTAFAAEPPGTVLAIYYLKTRSPGGYNAIVEEVLYPDQTFNRANFYLAVVRKNHIVKKSAKMDSQIHHGFFDADWDFHSEASVKDGKLVTSLGKPMPHRGRLVVMREAFWSIKPSATMKVTDSEEIIVEGKVSGEELHRRRLVRAEDFLDPDTQDADVYRIHGAQLSLDSKGLEQADVLVVKQGELLSEGLVGLGGGQWISGSSIGHRFKIIVGQLRDGRILPVDTLAGSGSRRHVYVTENPYRIENQKIELDFERGRIILKNANQSARLVRINKPRFISSASADTVAVAALNRWADAYPHSFEKLNPKLSGEHVETCETNVGN